MKFRMLSEKLAKAVEWAGIAGVLTMLMVTVIDTIGAKVFLTPLRGSTELVGFAQIIAISSTIAIGFFIGRHIAIEFFVYRLSAKVQAVINLFTSCLGFVLFVLLSWKSYTYALSLKGAGEISSTAHVPFYPFAFVISFCAVVTSLYFISEIIVYFTDRSGTVNESG